MYQCENCGGTFEKPRMVVERYPERGGERFRVCPICLVADEYEEVREWQENE